MSNSVLSMATTTRKKYDFFDKGRGMPEMEEECSSVTSLSGSSTRHSSPQPAEDQYLHTHPEEYAYSPSDSYPQSEGYTPSECYSPSISPLDGSSSVSSGYSSYNNQQSFQYQISPRPSAFAETPAYAEARARRHITSPTPSTSIASNSPQFEMESQYPDGGSSSLQNQKKAKRPQKCRMCANHNMEEDVKGHKWRCHFRNCSCKSCFITRKTQYYMKERQKMTRKMQQFPPSPGSSTDMEHAESPEVHQSRQSNASNSMEFPRRAELIEETNDILDPKLFEKINEFCRPKNSFRR